jgi:hypothetical protein
VGYVNRDLVAGLNLLTNPLSNGANKISEVLPNVADGTTVFTFNGTGFDQTDYFLGWSNGDFVWGVGVGAWVESLAAQKVTFVGEVLTGAASNKSVPQGLSLQGSLVPQAGLITTDLKFPIADGDTIFTWKDGGFVNSAYFFGWPETGEPNLAVAEGFWVDKLAQGTWTRDFTIQ